jgi:hypothetical protein
VWPLAVLWDVHGFPFSPSSVNGMGSEVRVRFGGPVLGIAAGVYLPGPQLDLGLDLFRYLGVVLSDRGGMQVTLDLPTLEPRVLMRTDAVTFTGAVGTSLTGIRLTRCPFVIDLRIPRVDLWIGPLDERVHETWSLGGTLSAGVVL